MPRNTTEREILVDSFDDEIAFTYVYRHQETLNDHLSTLAAMATEVMREVEKDAAMMSLPIALRDGIHYRVVNGLYNAVHGKCSHVDAVEARQGWSHAPDEWHYQQLMYHLEVELDAPWVLLQTLSRRLEQALPESIRPFTSLDQVLVITSEVLADLDSIGHFPLHLPSMANAMHAAFIERHSKPTSSDSAQHLLIQALERYRRLARHAGVEAIRSQFYERMIVQLMPQARALDIVIDRHYPWGALIDPPRPALDILADLAGLINEDRTWYKKWAPKAATSEKLRRIPFTEFLNRGVPRVLVRAASGPIYFSSERSGFILEGVPLQNRLAMVLPYDRPYPNLKQALGRFEKYFLRRAATHRADLGDPGAREHERNMVRHGLLPEGKVERVVVVRVTSIPMHLAALRSFESDVPEYRRKAKTSLKIDIHSEFVAYGFDFELTAIGEALESAARYQQAILEKLDLWTGRSESI
jgi:hypothetical protein